jgi:hypothetical protein
MIAGGPAVVSDDIERTLAGMESAAQRNSTTRYQ